MNDPLDDLLGADAHANEPLRDRLRDRTTRVVRNRRRLRRLGQAAILVACFVAGVAVARWWPASEPVEQPPVASNQKAEPKVHVDAKDFNWLPGPENRAAKNPKTPTPEPQPPSYVSIIQLEWQAFDSEAERAVLYLKAGNRYFAEMQDHESALRCYRQALDADPQIARRADPADNWLLAALKESRRKEN